MVGSEIYFALRQKNGKEFIVGVCYCIYIIVVSANLLCVPGGMNVARDIKNHKPMGFMPLCGI